MENETIKPRKAAQKNFQRQFEPPLLDIPEGLLPSIEQGKSKVRTL